jgi:lysophospholipase L1-like esterase
VSRFAPLIARIAFSVAALLAGLITVPAIASAATTSAATTSAVAPTAAPKAATGQWIGTWEAAPSGSNELGCDNCTIRNIVHTSIAGTEIRIHISNVFGTAPLVVGHATVALPMAAGSASVEPGTLTQVTFGGSASVTIAAGQDVWSDPIPLAVPANSDLLVTTYTPGDPTPFTWHPSAQEYSYYSSGADESDATSAGAFPDTTGSYYLLTGVSVTGSQARGDVVTFGDSITDGYQSTYNLDYRWPNILADRLLALPPRDQLGVLNAGIGGNRILLDGGNGFGPAALSRFQRDVVDQPGARVVIILLGINDIQQTPNQLNPNAIIAGLQQLIDMGHAAGLKVIGATLTPFQGWTTFNAQEEATWAAVDHWIRTSHAYDGVIDFDKVVRDPADPLRYLPAYDSGDHLHPNDAGYMAMGASISLRELGVTAPPGYTGPVVGSVEPRTASAGQTVTLRGTGFGRAGGYVQLSNVGTYWGSPVNDATLKIDSWSDRAITFTMPEPSGGGAWYLTPGTTATINVVDAAGAYSPGATVGVTPTADLSDYFDNTAVSPDTDQGCANMDGDGFSLSQQALAAAGLGPGASVTSGGLSYTWPSAAACEPDNALSDAQTVLVHGSRGDTTLGLLGTSTSGPSQGLILIHYGDGTESQATVTFGDWAGAPVSGDTAVATMPYRNSQGGSSQQLTVYVNATQVPVNPDKRVVSVTLPEIGYTSAGTALHIFALAVGS